MKDDILGCFPLNFPIKCSFPKRCTVVPLPCSIRIIKKYQGQLYFGIYFIIILCIYLVPWTKKIISE